MFNLTNSLNGNHKSPHFVPWHQPEHACRGNSQPWGLTFEFLWNSNGIVVRSGLQLNRDSPHRLGTPHSEAQTHSGSRNQNYIIHRQQTDLYLGLPCTEDTGQSTWIMWHIKCKISQNVQNHVQAQKHKYEVHNRHHDNIWLHITLSIFRMKVFCPHSNVPNKAWRTKSMLIYGH